MAWPLVGVAIEPRFSAAFRIAELLGPFLQGLRDQGTEVSWGAASGAIQANAADGLIYKVSPTNLQVEIAYSATEAQAPGELPRYDVPQPEPFSKLLARMATRTNAALSALGVGDDIVFRRIGVIAIARLAPEHAPPGIKRFKQHLQSPWEAPLTKADVTLLVPLDEQPGHVDQCHHILRFDTTAKRHELDLMLDWQRRYSGNVGSSSVCAEFDKAVQAAARYFEVAGSRGVFE